MYSLLNGQLSLSLDLFVSCFKGRKKLYMKRVDPNSFWQQLTLPYLMEPFVPLLVPGHGTWILSLRSLEFIKEKDIFIMIENDYFRNGTNLLLPQIKFSSHFLVVFSQFVEISYGILKNSRP